MALNTIDKTQFLSINHYAQHTPKLHGFMRFLSNEGLVIFAVLLVISYLLVRFVPRLTTTANIAKIAITGIGTVIAEGLNQLIGHMVKEPRPFTTLPHTLVLINRMHDYSFPSDHGVMIGGVTAGLYLVNPILGTSSLIIGLLVAFARVYVGVHYPHDLIGGMLVGASIVLFCYTILRKPAQNILARLENTPLRIFLHRKSA